MKNDVIKVLLVDDHAIVRLGIKSLIEKNLDVVVCGECGTLSDALEAVEDLQPDIVLLDIKLPDGDGVIGCKEIKKINPSSKVIILTAYGEDSLISEVIKAGADGYLLKNIDSKKIVSSIRDVANGKSILDSGITNQIVNLLKNKDSDEIVLTKQEQKILSLVSEGKTNKEIAKEVFIAEKTVRNYVSKIFKIIHAGNRTEAALYWIRYNSMK